MENVVSIFLLAASIQLKCRERKFREKNNKIDTSVLHQQKNNSDTTLLLLPLNIIHAFTN